jgi:hypothetical protein
MAIGIRAAGSSGSAEDILLKDKTAKFGPTQIAPLNQLAYVAEHHGSGLMSTTARQAQSKRYNPAFIMVGSKPMQFFGLRIQFSPKVIHAESYFLAQPANELNAMESGASTSQRLEAGQPSCAHAFDWRSTWHEDDDRVMTGCGWCWLTQKEFLTHRIC